MKKYLLILILFSCITNIYPQGKVIQSLSMTSKRLQSDVKYSVYLPEGFETSTQTYPILYLLNGFTGDETDWVKIGLVKDISDELIKGKQIIPMVIIMPDGDDRLYMNRDDGTYPYEDMFMTEFMPFVEDTYRIKKEKKFRAISGLSMGGSGSLRWALTYHDLFGSCAAFSAGISTEEEIMNEAPDSFDAYFGSVSPSIVGKTGKARLTETIRDYDVLRLVNTKDAQLLKSVRIYFDCGDDDFLTVGNSQLHIDLTKKGIPHEFRMRDGAHTWNFWRDSLPVGLKFISNSMQNY